MLSYEHAKPYFGDNALSTFQLICQNGDRQILDKYATCNFGSIPPHMILASSELSAVERDDILFALLSSADLYSKHPDYFRMFGDYEGQHDVLFKNIATGLESVGDELPSLKEYSNVLKELNTCVNEEKNS
uniref:Transferrin-like domain-containing protein n=1 Tax=Clastoptera arizonana TaxID=38151 RepID=A0A1B6DE78_9HEMI